MSPLCIPLVARSPGIHQYRADESFHTFWGTMPTRRKRNTNPCIQSVRSKYFELLTTTLVWILHTTYILSKEFQFDLSQRGRIVTFSKADIKKDNGISFIDGFHHVRIWTYHSISVVHYHEDDANSASMNHFISAWKGILYPWAVSDSGVNPNIPNILWNKFCQKVNFLHRSHVFLPIFADTTTRLQKCDSRR